MSEIKTLGEMVTEAFEAQKKGETYGIVDARTLVRFGFRQIVPSYRHKYLIEMVGWFELEEDEDGWTASGIFPAAIAGVGATPAEASADFRKVWGNYLEDCARGDFQEPQALKKELDRFWRERGEGTKYKQFYCLYGGWHANKFLPDGDVCTDISRTVRVFVLEELQ